MRAKVDSTYDIMVGSRSIVSMFSLLLRMVEMKCMSKIENLTIFENIILSQCCYPLLKSAVIHVEKQPLMI